MCGEAAAKAAGGAYRGRKPSYDHEKVRMVIDLLAQGKTLAEVARVAGLSRQTVYRIKDDPVQAEKVLAGWQARR